MTNDPWNISIEDIIKYHKCQKIRTGNYMYTCVGCEFDLPIEKFRYINSRRII